MAPVAICLAKSDDIEVTAERFEESAEAGATRRIAIQSGEQAAEGPTIIVNSAEAGAHVRLHESTRVGRYLVLRHIGAGAVGDVYLAYDETLDRRVAIKLLRPNAELDWSIRREAHALARLSHPNVVQIHDIGTHEHQPFIAMEFVNGAPLSRWLSAEPRTPETVLRMFLQCGRGLIAAHDAGLVHRDFKPSNVMVGDDGRARVLDFGVVSGPAVEVDRSGEVGIVGTPAYMSPEQLLSDPVGPASDQFSFAVAVFKAIYGESPFAGADAVERLHNVLAGRVRVPSTREAPAWLAPVLCRALERDPAARHPSLAALLAAIERHLPRDQDLDRQPTRQARRIFAGLVLAAVAIVVGRILIRGGPSSTTKGDLVLVPSVVLVLTVVALTALRKRVFANRFGVQMTVVFVIITSTALCFPLIGIRFGEPMPQLLAFDMLAVGFECALAGVFFVRWFASCAVLMFAGALVATFLPEWAIIALLVARFGALLIAFVRMSKD